MGERTDPVTLDLGQFGTFLSGREEGNMALVRLESAIESLEKDQRLLLDVSRLKVLNPSFVDESLTPLVEKHPGRFALTGRMGLAVKRGLECVESQRKIRFPRVDEVP